MSHKLLGIILVAVAALPAGSRGDAGSVISLLVHLPREITVQDRQLTLGQVSVIRGEPSLAAAAAKIPLGQLSTPGQKVTLDRTMILGRLASEGIPGEKVQLTGADAVVVRRFQKTITSEDLIETGRMYLRQHPPDAKICDLIPAAKPRELSLANEVNDLQVTPRFLRNGARGVVAIRITVAAAGRELGVRDVLFRLKYQCHRVVTVGEIAEGTVLTRENVRIETVAGDEPEPAGWQPPYGLTVVRTLKENTELRADMVSAPQSLIVVRRNETVVIRIERPGLMVTATGLVLQEGRIGECIKVRNTDSNRTVICKVNADGTVEPVL
ncbi:MAG: flagellar basal body P-ring formation chaperone FlgA [Solirubrobacterales bacterium]